VTISSFKDLVTWQEAMTLAEAVYQVTEMLPKAEQFGLISQARRAAVSVAANIAEGWGRDNRGMYIQHLRIAQGSLKELETHLLLSVRLRMVGQTETAPSLAKCDHVGRLLRGLIRSLEAQST
jgi:four helix bundle protein